MLARHRLFTVVEDEENADVLNHTNLSESFLTLGKDLDIMEAKTPEDIYKSNLSETRMSLRRSSFSTPYSSLPKIFVLVVILSCCM